MGTGSQSKLEFLANETDETDAHFGSNAKIDPNSFVNPLIQQRISSIKTSVTASNSVSLGSYKIQRGNTLQQQGEFLVPSRLDSNMYLK
ncbi:hypothetical protein SS50377_20500 [Spironucleus salmonicida]|uniref:Uncharacterized protein n=1 Tax=Spironucleus salmonicida TaxID=348837 RepID=V6LSN2_9EUKA|nr:hypothetical protein SS50377_20500 [Spironucleus salmonicida]|eukprot:EST43794.1 Hypothetical protein SS50377_16412 [Spironucleus salmonicida]